MSGDAGSSGSVDIYMHSSMVWKAHIQAHGYALLPRYAVEAHTARVAAHLGEPIMPWDGATVQHLVPRKTSTPNTYSGIFGLGRFPFHTDLAHWRLPPRYVLLRCVKGYADVPTLLLDGRSIVDAMKPNIMRRAIVRPRRPLSGEIRMVRLLHSETEGVLLRWDEVFLKPASKIGELAFCEIREHLESAAPTLVAMSDAGDTLIIDNWRMLHSRPAIPAGKEDMRMWLR